ncbi:hypothetical protein HALLA_03515 (plasmid) [Halostagnicola larsenii XH-48]|uniref:Uncharacterized protein n=1 Tax=Halostagnicola larsenii XH-48 TaxID=797299 RepID=W0JW39_9EURY|nr:hypothetical protein [Halostagnicola larsenii]AHG01470.1 hypothetical protein HALLA_03515 [Halostagnicola larsenii XH-48]
MVLEIDLEDAAEKHDDLPAVDDVYDVDEEIPLAELFDDAFVDARTDFDTFDELVAASPSDADSADALETVGHGEWDEFVAERTAFDDGHELVMAARDHWVGKRLGLA